MSTNTLSSRKTSTRASKSGSEKPDKGEYTVIPDEQHQWMLTQPKSVQKFWWDCWQSDRYGNRPMPLNTSLEGSTLRAARQALQKTGWFEFEIRTRTLEGITMREIYVTNLYGAKSRLINSAVSLGEPAEESNTTAEFCDDPAENSNNFATNSDKPAGKSDTSAREPDNPVGLSDDSDSEKLDRQGFQNSSLSYSLSFQYPSIIAGAKCGEEESESIKVLESYASKLKDEGRIYRTGKKYQPQWQRLCHSVIKMPPGAVRTGCEEFLRKCRANESFSSPYGLLIHLIGKAARGGDEQR